MKHASHLTKYQKRKKNLRPSRKALSGCRKVAYVKQMVSEKCKRNQIDSHRRYLLSLSTSKMQDMA